MKTLTKLVAMAVVATGIFGCTSSLEDNHNAAPAPKGVTVSMVASADTNEATRTALGSAENGSYKYEWSKDDQIGLSVIKEGTEVLNNVALKSASSAVSTTFGGTISEEEAAKIPAAELYDYVGWYPNTAAYNHSSGQISFTLPATHSASSNMFSGKYDFMIASAKNRSTIAVSDGMYPLAMNFQHVFAFFEIPLQSNNMNHTITKIVIEAAESELAGDVKVGFDGEGKPEIQTISNGSRAITVNMDSDWNASEKIWVPFIPGAAGEQITITLTNAIDMEWSFTKTAPAAGFARANVYRMSGAAPSYNVAVSLDNVLTLINNDASKTIKDPTALSAKVSASGVAAEYIEDLGVIYSRDSAADVKVSMANNSLSANNTWAGLSAGKYTVRGYATVGGVDFVSDATSVDVFGNVALSVVAPTSYSWYVGDNGQTKNVTTANGKDRFTIYAPTATMTADDSRYAGYANLLADCLTDYSMSVTKDSETDNFAKNSVTLNASAATLSIGNQVKSASTLGTYTVSASATFPTQGTITESTQTYVTGLPYKATPPQSSDNWSINRSYTFASDHLLLSKNGNALNVEATLKSLYVPANTKVTVSSSKIQIVNTALSRIKLTISCSGSSLGSLQGSENWNTNTFTFNQSGTLTTSNPTISLKTENNAAGRETRIYNLNVEYRD